MRAMTMSKGDAVVMFSMLSETEWSVGSSNEELTALGRSYPAALASEHLERLRGMGFVEREVEG